MQTHMGVKPPRSWQEAVVRRAVEAAAKASWKDEQRMLKWWDQYLGKIDDLNLITREMVDGIILKCRPVNVLDPVPANTTANKYVSVVSCILNDAERKWAWGNRAPVLRFYGIPAPKDVCPTPAEVLRLIAELPEHSADIALYGVATMHRRANLTGLEWPMIDWANKTVRVAGQFTKTGTPIYTPLNDTAMAVLERRRKANVRGLVSVFNYRGEPITNVTTRWWHEAAKRAGLPDTVTLHTMRHCANSWLAQRGVPREIRARLGGWALGGQAIDGYTHLYIEHLRPYVAMIDEALGSGRLTVPAQRTEQAVAVAA